MCAPLTISPPTDGSPFDEQALAVSVQIVLQVLLFLWLGVELQVNVIGELCEIAETFLSTAHTVSWETCWGTKKKKDYNKKYFLRIPTFTQAEWHKCTVHFPLLADFLLTAPISCFSLLPHPTVRNDPVRLAGSGGPQRRPAGSQEEKETLLQPTWTQGVHPRDQKQGRTSEGPCPLDKSLWSGKSG